MEIACSDTVFSNETIPFTSSPGPCDAPYDPCIRRGDLAMVKKWRRSTTFGSQSNEILPQLRRPSISLGILECLPTGESQCPEVVGTGIGDSAAQEGQRKDPGDEVLNQSTLLKKGQQWRSAGEIPTDIDTSGSGGKNRKAGPRKTRLDEVELYNLFLHFT